MRSALSPGYYPPMNGVRVLVASDLRSYREAVAAVLRELRPEAEVFEVEAEILDLEVRRLLPDMVVTSKLTRLVESRIPFWVELYPDCESHSVVSVRGRRWRVEDIQITDLVSVIDRVGRVARTG
jgi:hypothetical protein